MVSKKHLLLKPPSLLQPEVTRAAVTQRSGRRETASGHAYWALAGGSGRCGVAWSRGVQTTLRSFAGWAYELEQTRYSVTIYHSKRMQIKISKGKRLWGSVSRCPVLWEPCRQHLLLPGRRCVTGCMIHWQPGKLTRASVSGVLIGGQLHQRG